MGMILCAGYNWSPSLVGWGVAGRNPTQELVGYYAGKTSTPPTRGALSEEQAKKQTLNFWKVPGIYVLYKNDTVIYIGKSDEGGIGARLKAHHMTDHLVGRWDTFSWVSPTPIVENFPQGNKAKDVDSLSLGQVTAVPTANNLAGWLAEIEALGILLARPFDNRQVPNLSDDCWWFEQVKSQYAKRTHEEMLQAICDKLGV